MCNTTPRLPDFRNIGVWFRSIVLINLLAAASALIQVDRIAIVFDVFVEQGIRVQSLLLSVLGVLYLLNRPLQMISPRSARVCIVVIAMCFSMCLESILTKEGLTSSPEIGDFFRVALLSGAATVLVLFYFYQLHLTLRPADEGAQLAVLAARIRPHFLFNSLNAVLSLIRSDPRRAEAALESLAELFRVLMRDPRDLVPLSGEIALCRQYLELEKLRLGERLQIDWMIDDVPGEAMVPPLMLQPLLENAVYHGIEPADSGGRLKIYFAREVDRVRVTITNPLFVSLQDLKRQTSGHQLALDNIRQRLLLHYDLEARLDVIENDQTYCVTLSIPVRRQPNV